VTDYFLPAQVPRTSHIARPSLPPTCCAADFLGADPIAPVHQGQRGGCARATKCRSAHREAFGAPAFAFIRVVGAGLGGVIPNSPPGAYRARPDVDYCCWPCAAVITTGRREAAQHTVRGGPEARRGKSISERRGPLPCGKERSRNGVALVLHRSPAHRHAGRQSCPASRGPRSRWRCCSVGASRVSTRSPAKPRWSRSSPLPPAG
jgi:hypothetical protein